MIRVVEGDIAAIAADAIVNAANNHLWMGSGVAGALKRAGGQVIEDEAMALGPISVGAAVATSAGKLRARWVIHGAVMGQALTTDRDAIRRTTRACLRLADSLGARSIVFPALGTGVGGFPIDECARVMTFVADTHLAIGGPVRLVTFCVWGAEARAAFEREASS